MILLLSTMKNLMKKTLNLRLEIMSEHQSIKSIFAKGYAPNLSEESFVVKKKILCLRLMKLMI